MTLTKEEREDEAKSFIHIKRLRELAYKVASKYGDGEGLKRAALYGLADALALFSEKREGEYRFPVYATWFMKKSVENLCEQRKQKKKDKATVRAR